MLTRAGFITLLAAAPLSGCGSAGPTNGMGNSSTKPPGASPASPTIGTDLSGIRFFPADNAWNTRTDGAPLDPSSDTIIANHCGGGIGAGVIVELGMPYNVVSGITPATSFTFLYASESDAGPYPITAGLQIENGTLIPGVSHDDHHLLIVDRDNALLYELYQPYQTADGSWHADGGAIFNLTSNALRPDCWTSADAAGLPIVPGLVRYDEVAAGVINHALRITLSVTRQAFVHPATHLTYSGPNTPGWAPMGTRLRLKASFDISAYPPAQQTILTCLKQYGALVADNGTPFAITGTADPRWGSSGISSDSCCIGLHSTDSSMQMHGSDFEVVLMQNIVTHC